MPEMDGFALVARIRQSPALAGSAEIIMLTSAGQRGDAGRARELGVAPILTKPVGRRSCSRLSCALLPRPPRNHGCSAGRRQRPHCERARSYCILLAEDNAVNQKVAAPTAGKTGTPCDGGGERAGSPGHSRSTRSSTSYSWMCRCRRWTVSRQPPPSGTREHGTGRRQLIIAMTAHAMQGDRERCIAAGMDSYISKPLDVRELIEQLQKFANAAHEEPRPA